MLSSVEVAVVDTDFNFSMVKLPRSIPVETIALGTLSDLLKFVSYESETIL